MIDPFRACEPEPCEDALEKLIEVFHDDDPVDALGPGDQLELCTFCGAVCGQRQMRRAAVPFVFDEVVCPACAWEFEERYDSVRGVLLW